MLALAHGSQVSFPASYMGLRCHGIKLLGLLWALPARDEWNPDGVCPLLAIQSTLHACVQIVILPRLPVTNRILFCYLSAYRSSPDGGIGLPYVYNMEFEHMPWAVGVLGSPEGFFIGFWW